MALRIGYIPEHFATPLHFAFTKFGLSEHATIISFPSGTGTMIEAFAKKEIDVAIGLTDAFIVGISKDEHPSPLYRMIGSYTASQLTWAIVTGGSRSEINSIEDLWGKKVGISRMGSGSHIMASILAQHYGRLGEHGELPFELVECGPFKSLRDAVNSGQADIFMWEVITCRKFIENGELKYVSQLKTPWRAWHIAALGDGTDQRIYNHLLPALDQGLALFRENHAAAIEYITENMDYSHNDARAWYEDVVFASSEELRALDPDGIKTALDSLRAIGVLGSRAISSWQDLAPPMALPLDQSSV